MKRFICKVKEKLQGVSTLDIFKKSLNAICLLMVVAVMGSTIYGGHSTLDLVDPSFNPQIQTNAFGIKSVDNIIVLPNGKILVLGNFNSYNRQPVGKLIRLNADATLDTTFNNNSLTSVTVPYQIAMQSDGKIIVLGSGLPTVGQSGTNIQIMRLNQDGTIDPTFLYSYNNNDTVDQVVVDDSDRLLLLGVFSWKSGH